jgi:hypothetical protein
VVRGEKECRCSVRCAAGGEAGSAQLCAPARCPSVPSPRLRMRCILCTLLAPMCATAVFVCGAVRCVACGSSRLSRQQSRETATLLQQTDAGKRRFGNAASGTTSSSQKLTQRTLTHAIMLFPNPSSVAKSLHSLLPLSIRCRGLFCIAGVACIALPSSTSATLQVSPSCARVVCFCSPLLCVCEVSADEIVRTDELRLQSGRCQPQSSRRKQTAAKGRTDNRKASARHTAHASVTACDPLLRQACFHPHAANLSVRRPSTQRPLRSPRSSPLAVTPVLSPTCASLLSLPSFLPSFPCFPLPSSLCRRCMSNFLSSVPEPMSAFAARNGAVCDTPLPGEVSRGSTPAHGTRSADMQQKLSHADDQEPG